MPDLLHPAPNRPLSDAEASCIAKALSHPVRIRILRLIGRQEGCYCGDICQEIPLAQSTISQHLKVLREAGLIRGTPCGTAVGYCAVPSRLKAFHAWAAALAETEGIPAYDPPTLMEDRR